MMYIKNMRESLSRLPVRVFVLFALLVTVWLWGWFFIQGITYLDQWHLSLRDALITGVSLLILQIAVKQPLYSRLWRGAWLPFMAWISHIFLCHWAGAWKSGGRLPVDYPPIFLGAVRFSGYRSC